ncbi:unnamed protein product [Kluyveromyces dobzhanskii CBS 2104]|uniref:WGS project CCBQ000000000 data, contig 00015 n=1 Tax=Kluyveromyces dobzhanskii CBS 2104 TaxID=1427455 RepID=A0A0A8L9F9_9SACH|nr:unnamed protein product [Kluyveromyces dobzhanskii CBS 2104]
MGSRLRYEDYLDKLNDEVNSTSIDKMALHSKVDELLRSNIEMRASLQHSFDEFQKVDVDIEEWRKSMWPEESEVSPQVQYSYLRHQELSLERLIAKTLPKQLLLREETLKAITQQTEGVLATQQEQLDQLSQYRANMRKTHEQELLTLNDRWRSILNQNIEKALS